MKHNFRFSGTGGQGLITAGIILAEAAILDGKEAIQSQSYGPEARGGSSKAEAIISDDKIYFGRVTCPDVTYKERIDLPITHTAIGACGKSLFANIVALGAVVALTHCVSEEALEKAVLNRVPKGTEEANKKALQAGKDLIVTNKK